MDIDLYPSKTPEVEDVLRERGIELELEDLDPRDPRNLGKAWGKILEVFAKMILFGRKESQLDLKSG